MAETNNYSLKYHERFKKNQIIIVNVNRYIHNLI